jgi:hypothetical protein
MSHAMRAESSKVQVQLDCCNAQRIIYICQVRSLARAAAMICDGQRAELKSLSARERPFKRAPISRLNRAVSNHLEINNWLSLFIFCLNSTPKVIHLLDFFFFQRKTIHDCTRKPPRAGGYDFLHILSLVGV